jgi:hypothetical protein
MTLKKLIIALVFGYSMWTSPVGANADEFVEWTGEVNYGGPYTTLVVGVNKYNGDRVYILNPNHTHAQMQVVPAK